MCISNSCKYCCCVNSTWVRNRKYSSSKNSKINNKDSSNLSTCKTSTNNSYNNNNHRKHCSLQKTFLKHCIPSTLLTSSFINFLWSQTVSLTGQRSKRSHQLSPFLVHGLLIIVTFLCYHKAISGDFVHDDIEAIIRNPDVVSDKSSWTNLFANDFWGRPMSDPLSHKSYRPLTVLTFRLNMALKSGDNDATISWKFRLINLALHGLVVQLIVITARYVLNCNNQMSLLIAIHFATHPVHTEAVSSNVGRADILCCIFSFITFLAYSRSINEYKWTPKSLFYLAMTSLSATLALLSKETGIAILPICVLYYIFKLSQQRSLNIINIGGIPLVVPRNEFKQHSTHQNYLKYLLWLYGPIVIPVITTLALLWFRVSMLYGVLPIFSEQDNPASFSNSSLTRLLTYSYLCAFNGRLLVLPSRLSYDWQMGSIPLVASITDARNLETILTFFIVTAILYTCGRDILRSAYLSTYRKDITKYLTDIHGEETNLAELVFVGICFLIIPFLPASNLLVTVGFVVAERVLYIPSFGFSLLFVAGYYYIKRRLIFSHERFISWLNIAFYGLIITFTLKTHSQTLVWLNRETLFQAGLSTVPENAKMHYNYANLQKDNGNNELAMHHYREALRLWPTHESSWNNLATLLSDPDEAEWHLVQALRINPYHPKAHFNLACIYSKKGWTSQAISLLERSIELDSNFAEPYSSLASIYAEKGLKEDADVLHRKALKIQPNNPDLINNYGAFLQKTGQTEQAVGQYQKALKLNPKHKIAMANLMQILKSLNETNSRWPIKSTETITLQKPSSFKMELSGNINIYTVSRHFC